MARERAAGPALLLEAGNALFPAPRVAPEDTKARARAELILRTLGELKVGAMAVGARDLALGLPFLQRAAAAARVPLVSANLTGPAGPGGAPGKRPFPASVVLSAGGLKVGVVGASPEGPQPAAPGLLGDAAGPAVLAEARRLRPAVDVVVVLAALPVPQAQTLAAEAGDAVDFVLQSHEGRGAGSAVRGGSHALVLPSGERGRQLGRLELAVAGAGPFQDRAEAQNARRAAEMMAANIARVEGRLAAEKDPARRQAFETTLASYRERKATLERQAAGQGSAPARSFALSYLSLTDVYPGDAALEAAAARVGSPPGGH